MIFKTKKHLNFDKFLKKYEEANNISLTPDIISNVLKNGLF